LADGRAAGYQEDTRYAEEGLILRYQYFAPRAYEPPKAYMQGLSVIYYLTHDGSPLGEAFPDPP
jgi:hypothetical protein